LIAFDAIVVQVQMSFTKTKTQNILNFYFELFNTDISHLAQESTINMAIMWHHKNISNKITIFIEFWWLLEVLFGSFHCDYTLLRAIPWHLSLQIHQYFKCELRNSTMLYYHEVLKK
jgi:hypothetical protein